MASKAHSERLWGNLIHLSYNFWDDREYPGVKNHPCGQDIVAHPHLRFDTPLWEELLERMVDAGVNLVVLDLGDAVRYESHPEIAVKRAWSVKRLGKELDRMRRMGIEPIPKLNFSASHDIWMGEYHRMVSTKPYYAVCRDLIREVIRIFDKPRFLHVGMDEETDWYKQQTYTVIRRHELWWHDLLFYVNAIETAGSRAWMWSDYAWGDGQLEIFLERMPRSVLQSNWHYEPSFDESTINVQLFRHLAENGFDQIPTGSNFGFENEPPRGENFGVLVDHVESTVDTKQVLGYLQTPWMPTLPKFRAAHLHAIERINAARQSLDVK